MSHTPGPWVVCVNSLDNTISVEQDRERISPEDGEPTIVVQCVDDMGEGLDRETGMANARLIAMAPTMLDILIDLSEARTLESLDACREEAISLLRGM
jgi:hypothetical protein